MASAVAIRRREFRDKLFPHAQGRVWDRTENKGFFTVPRLIPYIMVLIKSLAGKGDPTSVYLDLWSRAFDEGMATITDEGTAAFASGYTGSRAVRTWRERMETLTELGFIEPKPAGNRKFAHVLLVNPLQIVSELRERDPDKVPETFWTAFVARAQEIGADLPEKESLANLSI